MSSLHLPPLSRRQLLLGATGGLLLAACGKSDGSDDDAAAADGDAIGEEGGTGTTVGGGGGAGLVLFKLFAPEQPLGLDVRLPIALADGEGSFDVEVPDRVTVRLRRPTGKLTAAETLELHDQDLPRGYFPLRTSFDELGRWAIMLEADDVQVEATLDVRQPGELPSLTGPGDPLPRIPTPTRTAKEGVDPICTADPVCPFHSQSLDQVIGGGNPIVVLVSTPAFCQVAICGPVLDILVARRARLEEAGVAVIHAEVYTDRTAKVTTPTVDALGLTFEPSLFLAAPDGTVTDRLDSIYDGAELDEALDRLVP